MIGAPAVPSWQPGMPTSPGARRCKPPSTLTSTSPHELREPHMVNAPHQQIPGVYHRRVGDIVVSAISDGFLDGTLDVLRNISQDEARQILTENFRPTRRSAVNAFLV